MDPNKSLDEVKLIAALLRDVETSHGVVFNNRARRLTLSKVIRRVRSEGISFLTKTMPRLAKAFDKALGSSIPLNCTEYGFKPMPGTKLPRFLGEFFSRVLCSDGSVLPDPCADSVKIIRGILYTFYKYKLPYNDEQEQQTIQQFKTAESELAELSSEFKKLEEKLSDIGSTRRYRSYDDDRVRTIREARIVLHELFRNFDPSDIYPRHGPGVVATKQRFSGKYRWTNVSDRITKHYPFDAYFCASAGHVCDSYQSFSKVGEAESSARVILVQKDSRGPRLISCEPVDFQWVQQGLSRALVQLVERHSLTKWNVRFTDQLPNRFGALVGSKAGKYATLDLKEASDRVSLDLVRLLFPSHVFTYLEACRSLSTELPDGDVLTLKKFAPMGSALCFPIMALTIWSLLHVATADADTRESIYVYGDDVIVPEAFASDAIEQLESFGLKVNRDKSCTSGFFRESCGMDAFKGSDVTPVRIRTVWSSRPSASVYCSWIAYANSYYDRRMFNTYELIVSWLVSIYGYIPGKEAGLACPSLVETPAHVVPKFRYNVSLQKKEYKVWDVKNVSIRQTIDGWSMLLRFFAEVANDRNVSGPRVHADSSLSYDNFESFAVSKYTPRRRSMLRRCWR
jgi:hypothetical protein